MDLRSRVYENVKRRLQDRAIAVDCEYHSTPSGKIDRIYCICACRADHSIFFNQAFARGGRCATLTEIADFLSVKDPIFICHALEIAERRAFLATGDRPDDHAWIDTFTLSQATENAACTDSSAQHSLVALCQKYLNVSIDSAAKEYMRSLCIDDCTEGHEIELLSYCREDVAHLHELAYRLITEHAIALHTSLHIGSRYAPGRCGIPDHASDDHRLSRTPHEPRAFIIPERNVTGCAEAAHSVHKAV